MNNEGSRARVMLHYLTLHQISSLAQDASEKYELADYWKELFGKNYMEIV